MSTSSEINIKDLIELWAEHTGQDQYTILGLISYSLLVNHNNKFHHGEDEAQTYEPVWIFSGGMPEAHREGEKIIIDLLINIAKRRGDLEFPSTLFLKKEPLIRIFEREQLSIELPPVLLYPLRYVFRQNGDVWEIGPTTNIKTIPHFKGFSYIHCLLMKPNKEIDAKDLVTMVERQPNEVFNNDLDNNISTQAGLDTGSDIGITLDLEAKKAYEEGLEEAKKNYQAAIEHGDTKESEKHRKLITELEKILKSSVREKTHKTGAKSHSNRSRDIVRNNIKTAINKLDQRFCIESPQIVTHLKANIKKGYSLSYQNDENIEWLLKPTNN